ncbi:MAG: DUF3783 domain-containing protein [Lachnospiraceae bacterium]|nr:DUF3783 domain-containing protein [Lachnospiraceae bacterium]
MKHRTSVRNREVVLLYRFRDTQIGRQLHAVAARMGILCKVVEEEQTEETLGALLKLPGFVSAGDAGSMENDMRPETGTGNNTGDNADGNTDGNTGRKPELTRQVMIMHGFTNQRLNEFLQNMRKAGMPIIPLKAIVTPRNISWTFRTLYEELEKEHEAVQKSKEGRQ